MYTDCLIGMGLLVSVCAALLTDPDAITDIDELANLLADNLPSQSVFWMGYLLNAAFFGLALEISGIISIVMRKVGMYSQPEMVYFTAYPSVIMMFCVTLTYSVIAPITIIWGTIYFAASYWVYKYKLLYVYKIDQASSYTWTRFRPNIFSRLHLSLFIMQLIVLSLLSQIPLSFKVD